MAQFPVIASGGSAPPTGYTYRLSGFPINNEAVGLATMAPTWQQIGDLAILSVQWHDETNGVASVSAPKTGAWQRAVQYRSTTDTLTLELWWAVTTGTGADTVTVTYNSALTTNVELILDELGSTLSPTWTMVVAGGASSPSGTSVTWPNLTSANTTRPQIYWGSSETETSGAPGGGGAWVWGVTAHANEYVLNLTMASASPYQAASSASPAGISTTAAVIFHA